MADAFHATFKPGTTINISDTLVIAFDKPKEADSVTVTLSETDAWVADGKKVVEVANSKDVLIGEFTGKIVGGKFQGALTKNTTPSAGVPPLKVRFDGEPPGTSHRVDIPASTLANEEGIFEVLLKVKGKVAGKPGSFIAPAPVFVRNFKHGRPVIAFITGSDGAGYFTAAKAFMETYADATLARNNVLDIREFLRTESAPRGFGPWGEVNIVDHGNAVEWVIKLASSDKNLQHLRSWHVADAAAKPPFQPPITSVLDSNSTVVIRGCAIGRDKGLLDEIRKLFGGQCKVLAPKFLQEYAVQGSTARESFFEFFHFYATQGPANGPASVPSDDECRKELKAKFPNPIPPISDADWLTFLGRRALHRDGYRTSDASGKADRRETITWREARNIQHTPERKQDAIDAAKAVDWRGAARQNFNAADERQNLATRFADWHFVEGPLEEKPISGGTRFSRLFTGTRVRIEVRRELRNVSGTPVKPDLTNPAHYGSSP
jgi:hypothetical protein